MSLSPNSVFSPAGRVALFAYRHSRVIHAGKLALALLIADLLHAVWPMPHFIWCMVTIVIIMMSLPQLGAAVEKSLMRTVGTIAGAILGVLLVTLFSNHWLMMIPMLATVAVLCHRAGGRYSYAYLVTGITIIIVTGDAGHDGPSEALWRTANILIGCAIAAGISLFVFPIRAKHDWREQLAVSLGVMASAMSLREEGGEESCASIRPALGKGVAALARQRQLFFSLEWESRTLKERAAVLAELADAQARVFTLLELLLLSDWKDGEDVADPELIELSVLIRVRLEGLVLFIRDGGDGLPAAAEPLAVIARRRIRTVPEAQEAHFFAVNGYCWLLQQLASTVDLIRTDVYRLAEGSDSGV